MLGHLGLNVADLGASKAYYDTVMPALGFEPFLAGPDQFAYRPVKGRGAFLFFYPCLEEGSYSPDRPGLQHLAFMVPTRTAVREAQALAAGLGSEIVHEARTFPEYPPPYYACFWHDLNGFLLEAVCHYDRE